MISADESLTTILEPVAAPVTWTDVARRLASIDPADDLWRKRPDGLLTAMVYWTGLRLDIRNDAKSYDLSLDWLKLVFPHRLTSIDGTLFLLLDGPEGIDRLQVKVATVEDFDSLDYSIRASVESDISFSGEMDRPLSNDTLPVFACHSVKGGVGRTTTAISLAQHLINRFSAPVLLIDGDFEAPGISFLLRKSRSEFATSFEDLIAIKHADNSRDASRTISFVSDRLADLRVGDLFILPVRRQPEDLVGSAIRPEHLPRTEQDGPFALTTLLRLLGRRLGCAAVVIDLRAGLVQIAAQLLLDPSVSRLFVTTISGQALDATAAMLQFVGRELRRHNSTVTPPLIVFNRVPSVFESTNAIEALRQPLLQVAVQAFNGDSDREVQGLTEFTGASLQPVLYATVREISDLAVAASGWDDFSEQIKKSDFATTLAPQFDMWLSALGLSPTNRSDSDFANIPSSLPAARAKLAEYAELLVAAETAKNPVPAPLVTAPLRHMAVESLSRTPILISEGTKGTGKTLMARFLVSQRNWRNAVQVLSGRTPVYDAAIIPVYCSTQAGGNLLDEVTGRRSEIARSQGFGSSMSLSDLKDTLLIEFSKAGDDAARSAIWLDAIAWSVGFEVGVPGAGHTYLKLVESGSQRSIALFEGLEELFPDIRVPTASAAIRALIVDTANRLRLSPGRRLGLIVFARSDSVAAALPQNLEQFRLQNREYALTWTEADVLELGAWLTSKSEAIPHLWSEDWKSLSDLERVRRLNLIWGNKLGPDDTTETRVKEARTSLWLVAVLSDLQGRITARDFVRLIANAGKYQPLPQISVLYPKRVLVPPALRSAVEPASQAKVREIQEEIPPLREVFEKFLSASPEQIPLDSGAVERIGLTKEELDLLRTQGVILGDRPPYEVAELFRVGLNLRPPPGRRNVINLLRQARGRIGA